MTKLEESIANVLKGKASRSMTSFDIHRALRQYGIVYGPRGKQIVGMAIGRMRRKGVEANYSAWKV